MLLIQNKENYLFKTDFFSNVTHILGNVQARVQLKEKDESVDKIMLIFSLCFFLESNSIFI
jgi:hypothetical protein